MGSAELRNQARAAPSESGPAPEFYTYFAVVAGICGLLALYVHRDCLHGADVHLAQHDAMAAELSVRELRRRASFPVPGG